MRQSNRDRHNQKSVAQKRGVGIGYRGSYYGSDSHDLAMLDDTATLDEKAAAVRCADISPDPPEQ